jgi:hypothetical protein
MKKSFILLLFIANLAFGQSVTISPTDANNTLILKEGTAQMTIKGIPSISAAGKTNLNLEAEANTYGLSNAGISSINFNKNTTNEFSIKHTTYSTFTLSNIVDYSWLSFNKGTSEIARFEDDAFVAKKIGINNYDPFYQFTFNSSFGDKLSLNGRTCSIPNPITGGCSLFDENHFGIGYQTNLFQIFSRDASGDIAFGYGKSSSMTERVRFKGNGNVGIGINPTAKLHVGGTESEKIRLENSTSLATNVSNEIYFKTGNFFTGGIKTIGTSTQSARMGFFTYADATPTTLVERVSISDVGNVGIGVTNPLTKLHVDGSIRSASLAGTGVRNVYTDANGNLTTSQQTRILILSSSDFGLDQNDQTTYVSNLGGDATIYNAGALGNSGFAHNLKLPHGAIVTNITYYYNDVLAGNFEFRFYRDSIMDTSSFSSYDSQNSNTNTGSNKSISTNVNVVIDETKTYNIYARVLGTSGFGLDFKGVKITYTY